MIRKYVIIWAVLLITQALIAQTEVIDYVNPLIGTMSKNSLSAGNTYPAIARPWGMNFWTPQTGEMNDTWTYSYTADKIVGFKQTHQPSPWIGDYGQFSIMPVTGGKKISQEDRSSWFSHKAEIATPYYYSVYLADHDIKTEFAPTERAVSFRFTFPQSNESYVVIDAFDNGSYIKIIPEENTIIGYTTKNSGGVPANFKNYFVVIFDKPFLTAQAWKDNSLEATKKELEADHVGAIVGFKTGKGEKINARIASSFISFEQAYQNLKETDQKNLETIKAEGKAEWNKVLSRIKIDGGSVDQYRTFYSSLYRTLLFPRKLYEIDKQGKKIHYSPYNGKICEGPIYTDTGFWDTFRSLFPLLNLIYPEVSSEIQEGLVNTYKESGFLPEWASPGHRDCMVGNNSASIVADAFMKNININNADTLYKAMLSGANSRHPNVKSTGRWGYEYYNTLGYIPYDVNIPENTARTLEYAYDDWCIMKMAEKLNRPKEEIALYAKRAMNYKNVFDKETNLMRGRNKNGTFQTPFNPFKWGDAFTEGNSWHYTWSVFHDVQGLIDLMGGKEQFVSMLDSVFVMPPIYDDSYYGFCIHEIKEMQIMNMGNYAHGNQPIQHMIYLYNYAGASWKAQYWLREVMNRMYTPLPDGYCGDEDNGQTSAWYVFSALGFYPVCPGTDQYVIGAPLFKYATLTMGNGKTVTIKAPANSDKNRFVNSIKVNGKLYSKNYFEYTRMQNGATIEFDMGNNPNKTKIFKTGDAPYSFSLEKK
jgi:predicted alpha-1,2-mannosidase